MYKEAYSIVIVRKLSKLKKKDPGHYKKVFLKMKWVLDNPDHRYKFLHHSMKGVNRIHIKHFVLTFIISHEEGIVSFEDYDHHDKIYRS